jgi:uncharacterized protein YndB with AHSA1/START domain
MKITVETIVRSKLDEVWKAWNNPADITRWNAREDRHTTRSNVDLRQGNRMSDGRDVQVEFVETQEASS